MVHNLFASTGSNFKYMPGRYHLQVFTVLPEYMCYEKFKANNMNAASPRSLISFSVKLEVIQIIYYYCCFQSPNVATQPLEKIRRITTTWPNDPQSPFHDTSGTPMQPLARLTIKRQRVYEKSCTDGPPGPDDTNFGILPEPEDCERSKYCQIRIVNHIRKKIRTSRYFSFYINF